LNYIITYTKTKFYPLNPVKSDINIEDIAHALSLMTRANGHFKHFYSVAQHSINCYEEAKSRRFSTRVQLGCLLHDASESYISQHIRETISIVFWLPLNFSLDDLRQKYLLRLFKGFLTENFDSFLLEI